MRCSNKISSNRKIFRPEKERQDYGGLLPPRWPPRHGCYTALPPPPPNPHQEAHRPERPALATPLRSQAPAQTSGRFWSSVTGGGGGMADSQGTGDGAADALTEDERRSPVPPPPAWTRVWAEKLSPGSEPKRSPRLTQRHTAWWPCMA